MKKFYKVGVVIMIVALICMGINHFITPLGDVVIRVIGSILMIDLIFIGYSTVKLNSKIK